LKGKFWKKDKKEKKKNQNGKIRGTKNFFCRDWFQVAGVI
jgi:hypothetical protein